MKRRLIAFGLVLVVVVVVGLVAASFFMGTIIKKGVETAGPAITKTEVKLQDASLALFSGSGQLKGFFLGNPTGFKTPSAVQIGSMEVTLVPRSVFSDKVVVHSIRILAPEITFEGGLQGNNLSKLLDNIRGPGGQQSASKGSQPASGGSRKIQVDELVVSGGRINLSLPIGGGKTAPVPLPDIHLANLGQGPDGITVAELSEQLMHTILENATKAAAGQLGALGQGLGNAAQNLSTGAVQQVGETVKGLGNLLKGK